jgi:hypothetical protein
MKRTTLALAAILALGAATAGSAGAVTSQNLNVATPGTNAPVAGVHLAASYRYYRIVPRRFVRIQLRHRGYRRIHKIRLIQRHHAGYGNRGYYRSVYVAHAWRHGRLFRVIVNAHNGIPVRRIRIR